MKKIKIFICTYKRSDVLNELLENIFTSDFKETPFQPRLHRFQSLMFSNSDFCSPLYVDFRFID